ncbi:MAG: S41 family peptidase [Verrucomicrobiae bacterium]|nr:S41 family peptidase [Verrucomicrobiae bacterium]
MKNHNHTGHSKMKSFTLSISIATALAASFAAGTDVDLQQTAEIISLLKSNYVDAGQLDAKRLTDATVGALLRALGPGAQLLSAEQARAQAPAVATACTPQGRGVARAEIIDPKIGYLRLGDVEQATIAEVDAELSKFLAAKVTAYVLDLRFANGTNFAAAAALAERFLREGGELFSLQAVDRAPVSFRAQPRATGNLGDAPLMILVNNETRGAAAVLAGALRAQDRGILIGTTTAAHPLAWRDLPLRDGRILRVATAKIALPKGEIFPGGLQPDIPVKIDLQTERETVLNAPTNITLTASLTAEQVPKIMTEADLVRYHRGEAVEFPGSTAITRTNAASGANGKAKNGVRDLVLQRAVDILKGIRVLLSRQCSLRNEDDSVCLHWQCLPQPDGRSTNAPTACRTRRLPRALRRAWRTRRSTSHRSRNHCHGGNRT